MMITALSIRYFLIFHYHTLTNAERCTYSTGASMTTPKFKRTLYEFHWRVYNKHNSQWHSQVLWVMLVICCVPSWTFYESNQMSMFYHKIILITSTPTRKPSLPQPTQVYYLTHTTHTTHTHTHNIYFPITN